MKVLQYDNNTYVIINPTENKSMKSKTTKTESIIFRQIKVNPINFFSKIEYI